jgi:hypothetical protein
MVDDRQDLSRLRQLKRLRELEAREQANNKGLSASNQLGLDKVLARSNVNNNSNMGVPSTNGMVDGQVNQGTNQVDDKGFLSSVGEFFTGSDRQTQNTKNLPEIGQGGLLFGEDKTKAAAITPALLSATDPEEMAQILQSNFENIGIVRDQQGNVFAANNNTGARVVLNKPGVSQIDILQGLGIASLFTPAGTAQGALRVAGAAGATSAGIEAVQAVSGGDFSFQQIAIDTVAAGLLDKAFTVAKATGRKIRDVLKTDVGVDPDIALQGVDPDILQATDDLIDRAFGAVDDVTPPNVSETLREASQPNLTPKALAAIKQAEGQGVQLTKAQATQDFASNEAEQTLLTSVSEEGLKARNFAEQQQKQLRAAAKKFTEKFGGSSRLSEANREIPELTVRDKGAQIQAALEDVEELTRQEVSNLYKLAAETTGEPLPLNNIDLVNQADEIMNILPVTKEVRETIDTALAKFGLLGNEVAPLTRNLNAVIDGTKRIEIVGEITPLTLNNAPEFRKQLNKAVGSDTTGAASSIVRALDDQVNNLIKQGGVGEASSARVKAFGAAIEGYKDRMEKFSAKDVIQDLVSFKKNTSTPTVDPETVINKIVKGDKAVTNIRKLKQILLENPTEQTKKAWRSIQAETVGDILSQAVNKNTLKVSGERLNTAIGNYRPEALRELLGKKQFAELRRLQEIIGTATIAPPNTTNPSGTFVKLFAAMERLGNFAGAGQFNFGSLVAEGIRKGKDIASRKATLDGIINTKMQALKIANPSMSAKSLEQASKALAFLEIRELDKEEK